MTTQSDRLRAFALNEVAGLLWPVNDDALVALAEDLDPNGWRPWQETQAEFGQWFLWRDPDEPHTLHADQADPDARGFIEMKYGCGLDFYPECQPLQMADDVKRAVADAECLWREREESKRPQIETAP